MMSRSVLRLGAVLGLALAGPGCGFVTIGAAIGIGAAVGTDGGDKGGGPAGPPPPMISSLLPPDGPVSGGTVVTLSGNGFQGGATVAFGGVAATSVTVVSGGSVNATTPAGLAGPATVRVANPDGQSVDLPGGFTYGNPTPTVVSVSPASGPVGGGTSVDIVGSGFTSGSTVSFGGTMASTMGVVHGAWITAITAPAASPGPADVAVTNPGPLTGTLTGGYAFTAPAPTVTAVSPSSGLSSGGTSVTITGTGFYVGATVRFGTATAGTVSVVSGSMITAVTPSLPGGGVVSVSVTNTDGQAGALAGGFTYLGGWLVTGFGAGGVVGSDPSARGDAARAVVLDGTNLYVVGYDGSPAVADSRWRVEKRLMSTGATVSGFGTGGVATSDPTTGYDQAVAAVRDSTDLYVVGSENVQGGPWRIEKISLGTGALVSGFGTGGIVTTSGSSGSDEAALAVPDGGYLFVAGYDEFQGAGDAQWRIEKMSLATGASDTGFGGGSIGSNPSSGPDWATGLVTDGLNYYLAGSDMTPGAGNSQWRIEKRALGNGSLAGTFGSGGVLAWNPSSRMDVPTALARDANNLYVAGFDEGPGVANMQWRIEKRTMGTGALVSGFGSGGVVTSDPSTGDDRPTALLVDGPSLYVLGFDEWPGLANRRWRIERRSLATGTLDPSFGTGGVATSDPSTGDDLPYGFAADAADLYIVGTDMSPGAGNFQWRIEKRAK